MRLRIKPRAQGLEKRRAHGEAFSAGGWLGSTEGRRWRSVSHRLVPESTAAALKVSEGHVASRAKPEDLK
jgi:hypothetical protein